MVDIADEETGSGDLKAESKQFLTFQLAGEVYGVDILNIREIIDYGNLTPVPMMPEFIAGVINLRGAVVPSSVWRSALDSRPRRSTSGPASSSSKSVTATRHPRWGSSSIRSTR